MGDEDYYEKGCAKYYYNGDIEIGISPTGTPQIEAIMPAPGKTEVEREKAHQDNLDFITLGGYLLLETRRAKNKMFDKPGENTSWIYKYRYCKNEDEAKAIVSKIRTIMERLAKQKQREETPK